MNRIILVLIGVASLAAVCGAQCSATEHPNCASWAKNGFCTNPGYTKAYLQQYCPKTCTNCGCTCPSGTTFVANPVNNKCSSGTLTGSVCCASNNITVSNIIGPQIYSHCPIGYVMQIVGVSEFGPEGECVVDPNYVIASASVGK